MQAAFRSIAVSCLITLVSASLAAPVYAFRSSVGAVSGQKKLTDGMGNGPEDLTFSPILLEMAKLIGRTGLPPGFFLQNDNPSFPDGVTGVDLRTLLLYQAGLIKMPIRLITGRKGPAREPAPTLIVPAIPEPRQTLSGESGPSMPSLASTPMPREPERAQVVTPKRNVGEPDKISFASSGNDDAKPSRAPMISIDVTKLQSDLQVFGDQKDAADYELKTDVPQLAMAMPRTNSMPFITQNAFRLWTYRPEQKGAARFNNVPGQYQGTFVVATTGAIKSITGRHFVVASGKLLARNLGGELIFKTGLAEVSIEPNATAVIDVVQHAGETNVKVFALETDENSSVIVTTSGAKQERVQIKAGESVTIATKAQNAPSVAKAGFQIQDYVRRELIVNPEAGNNAEQFSAISSLKKRVIESQPR